MFSLPETLATERLIMRRLKYEDAEEIFYAYASKHLATKYLSWPTHRSVDDTINFLDYARFAWHEGTDFSYSIRIKESNRLAGSIGAINDAGRIQIGYVFSPTQWGRGYATEACKALVSELVKHPVKYIGTIVDLENRKSANVLVKAGFQLEKTVPQMMRFPNQHYHLKDCLLFSYPINGKI